MFCRRAMRASRVNGEMPRGRTSLKMAVQAARHWKGTARQNPRHPDARDQ
jgi:hypothetical protein